MFVRFLTKVPFDTLSARLVALIYNTGLLGGARIVVAARVWPPPPPTAFRTTIIFFFFFIIFAGVHVTRRRH